MSRSTPTPAASRPPTSLAGIDPDVVIRIAPDGRVYFHDITAPIAAVAAGLAPDNRELAARARLAAASQPARAAPPAAVSGDSHA